MRHFLTRTLGGLLSLCILTITTPALADSVATVRVPMCLQFPDTNKYVPCTGVVPVDSVTGNALDWASAVKGSVTDPSYTTPVVNNAKVSPTNPLPTKDSTTGPIGGPAPNTAGLVGGRDVGGNLRALVTDAAGFLYVTCPNCGTGGSTGGSNTAAAVVGSATPTYASYTGYLGADNTVHAWSGDNFGHPYVSISNLPTTQAISAATLPLPSGAAKDDSVNTLIANLGTPFQANGLIGNASFGASQTGLWSVGITGKLPAYESTPVFDLGNLNGAASDAKLQSLATALGSPFQSGGSIGNTVFGATQSGSWSVGVTGPVAVTGQFYQTIQPVSQSGNWTTTIGGTLPAFAAPPTVNLGTLNGAATDTSVKAVTTALGSPFQVGGFIGNTSFGASQTGTWTVGLSTGTATIGSISNTSFASTVASGANVDLFALRSVLPTTRGTQTSANSLGVTLSSDGSHAKTTDITALQTQLHNDLVASTPAGSAIIGNLYRAVAYNETTTALGANATFTPPTPRDSGAAGSPTATGLFSCFALSDKAGTLNQQASNDNTVWYTEYTGTISANVSATTTGRVFTRYHRCQVVNGSTAQGSLVVQSQLGN